MMIGDDFYLLTWKEIFSLPKHVTLFHYYYGGGVEAGSFDNELKVELENGDNLNEFSVYGLVLHFTEETDVLLLDIMLRR